MAEYELGQAVEYLRLKTYPEPLTTYLPLYLYISQSQALSISDMLQNNFTSSVLLFSFYSHCFILGSPQSREHI